MKKLLALLSLIIPTFCLAQTPVINSAPQKWLKWGRFAGSLYVDTIVANADSSNKVPTTAWVKRNAIGNTLPSLTFGYGFTGQPFVYNGTSTVTSKIDTSSNGLQTYSGLFPRGDTRWVPININSTIPSKKTFTNDTTYLQNKLIGIGDFAKSAISLGAQSPMPLMTIAQNVNWSNINYDQFRNFSVINPVTDSTAVAFGDNSFTAYGTHYISHLASWQDRAHYSGSGTGVLALQFGFYSRPIFDWTTLVRKGAWILNPTGSGTLGTNYGIYIDNQTKGTTNYGLYNELSPMYSGGKFGFGTQLNPIAFVDVGTNTTTVIDSYRATNTAASSVGRVGYGFFNSNSNTNQAQISANAGTLYKDSRLYFSVADTGKVLRDRQIIDVWGNVITSAARIKTTPSTQIIKNPCEYYSSLATTGAIAIKHASQSSATRFDFKITFYNYNLSQVAQYRIAYYKNTATTIVNSVTSTLLRNVALPSEQIRVGFDASGNMTILLGDVATAWTTATTVTVDEVTTSNVGFGDTFWDSGWSISAVTDLTGYTGLQSSTPVIITNPMTTAGDLTVGGTGGMPTRLAAGTSTQVLHGGTTPSWSAVSLSADVSGTLSATNGGTSQSTYATGDLLYASATNTLSKRGIGSSGQVLTVSGGVPSWSSSIAPLTITGTGSGNALVVNSGSIYSDADVNVQNSVNTGAALYVGNTNSGATGIFMQDVQGSRKWHLDANSTNWFLNYNSGSRLLDVSSTGIVKMSNLTLTNIPTGTSSDSILVKNATDNGVKKISADSILSKVATNGTWAPASSTVTLTVLYTYYQRVGDMITAFFYITFPTSVDGSQVAITGLPGSPYNYYPLNISINTSGLAVNGETATTGGSILLSNNSHTAITYAQMSGASLAGSVTYRVPH